MGHVQKREQGMDQVSMVWLSGGRHNENRGGHRPYLRAAWGLFPWTSWHSPIPQLEHSHQSWDHSPGSGFHMQAADHPLHREEGAAWKEGRGEAWEGETIQPHLRAAHMALPLGQWSQLESLWKTTSALTPGTKLLSTYHKFKQLLIPNTFSWPEYYIILTPRYSRFKSDNLLGEFQLPLSLNFLPITSLNANLEANTIWGYI